MLIGRLILVISLSFAVNVHAEELSLEDIIQKDVVDTCEKLNKPKVNATCDLNFAKQREPAAVDTSSLKRCDPNRKDEPAQKEMTNFLDRKFQVSSIKYEEAQDVFKNFYSQKRRYALNVDWADKACAQRSQMIASDLLRECKISSAKVFLFPSRDWTILGNKNLSLEIKGRTYNWDKFHVANVIYVEKDGKTEPYVVDPLVFDKIVPLSEWEETFKKLDPSLSTRITSSSVYRHAADYDDDPSQPLSVTQALTDLEKMRNDRTQMRKYKK